MAHICNEITDSNEKEQTTATPNNMNESCRRNIKQKKSDTEQYTLYDSIYMKFKNGQNQVTVAEVTTVVSLGGHMLEGSMGEAAGVLEKVCILTQGEGTYTDVYKSKRN